MVCYIENYLKDYGDKLVSEKTLKYILPIIYSDVIKEISIKQICSFYDDVDLIDDNLKNKRFDFISISNKLIIEFDGKQHFEHIEHFGSFEQFVERQSIDLDKQKFIKTNNFNLLRITGKLTLNEFYDLIKDVIFNNESPKAIFIENNNIYETSTDKLKDTLDEGENLNVIIFDLKNQVKMLSDELKNQANYFNNQLNNKKLIGKNKKILNSLTNSDNDVYLFLDWMHEHKYLVGIITTNVLYQMYTFWNYQENSGSRPLKSREFTSRVKNHLLTFNLRMGDSQTTLSALRDTDFNISILNEFFFDNKLQLNKYNKTNYIICSDQITEGDILLMETNLALNSLDVSNFYNYKNLMILKHLMKKDTPNSKAMFELIMEDKYR